MWNRNEFTRRLGVEWPILQAPMAGGISTPALAAAVSNAGGLGAFAVGALPPDAVQRRDPRDPPAHLPPLRGELLHAGRTGRDPDRGRAGRGRGGAAPLPRGGRPGGACAPAPLPRLEDQVEAALSEGFAVFSCTFGIPAAGLLERVRGAGALLVGTATTPAEAAALEAAGFDAVVAQGAEAGGHRGTFAGAPERALIGTIALVPRVASRVRIPVVAAGGIADGRGVAAVLALGARAAQLGTAFLACTESGASAAYRAAVTAPHDVDRTALTVAFSGRMARGLRNRFVDGMAGKPVLPFPLQNALTQDMRAAAARAGDAGLLSAWAGQGLAPRSGVSGGGGGGGDRPGGRGRA